VDKIYYAIGDIHGELSKLKSLHENISNFHYNFYSDHPHTRIHLGDYVDRGPESQGVIQSFDLINLQGNHEIMMLEAYQKPNETAHRHWLTNGGQETLSSYENSKHENSYESHIEWISNLPTLYRNEERKLIFVHAGIDPETYPEDNKAIHLWTRNPTFFDSEHWINPALENTIVIHGHTPTLTDYPDISKDGRRINVDTGACYGGPLSAVVLVKGEKPRFLFSD